LDLAAVARPWGQTAALPEGGVPNDIEFARSISLSQGTLVAGMAFVDDWDSYQAGAAAVFTQDEGAWAESTGLYGDDCDENACYFGWSVSIDADRIAAGADGSHDNTGSVYVFSRTGGIWSDGSYLAPDDVAAGEHFGWSVALEGDVVVAGSPFGGPSSSGTATVFVFE
jgi:hypothetical protein